MMERSIDNFSGLSTSAKNTYGEIFRDNQPDKFDFQEWIDQSEDQDTKIRRSADLLELKLAGLVHCEFELVNIRVCQRRPSHQVVETDLHSDKLSDEPNSNQCNNEKEDPSTCPKAAVNDNDSCPLTMLPPDILALVLINHIPIIEWPKLELLPPFLPAVLHAWRQVRSVNVERDCMVRLENDHDPTSRGKTIAGLKSILQMLVQRSPFLTSISGIDIPRSENDGETKSDVAHLLAQFEHLESLTMGDAELLKGVPLEALVEFLETTRSRTCLKKLHVFRVHDRPHDAWLIRGRFTSSLLNGQEIRVPLKFEKFSIELDNWYNVSLDNIDASRLTDIRLGKESIEPSEWIRLLERASKLRWIELKFLLCGDSPCNDNNGYLQLNKELLSALAAHESLSVIKLACSYVRNRRCKCLRFEKELLQMLKTIGARGQLERFAMDCSFVSSPHNIDMDRVLKTICAYIPSLQSIKLLPKSDEAASRITHLQALEDVDFMGAVDLSPNVLPYIVKLPHLKRLSLSFGMNDINDEEMSAMECLANATSLVDLRITGLPLIGAGVAEKWTNTLAPNLQVLMLQCELCNEGMAMLLEKAVKLRVLDLDGLVTDRMLEAVAKSCPNLEILGIDDLEYLDEYDLDSESEITVQRVQQIVDNRPKLRRLGVIDDEIFNSLQISKGRKIKYNEVMSFSARLYD